MIAISRRDTFPLAIAVLAFAFLGLFLLYPLLNVFGASFLDRTGTNFTLAKLCPHAVEQLLSRQPEQQPDPRRAVDAADHRSGRAARLLPRPPADPGQIAAAGAGLPAACAPVLRRCLCARAAVRPCRHHHALPARHRHPLHLDLRHDRDDHRLRHDALPLRRLSSPGGVQVGRRLGRGGGAESRLLALAHLLDRHRADRDALDPGRRAAGLHRGDREFRRALRAGRGQADPGGRGLQAVRRRDRWQSRLGRRARRAVDRLHRHRAPHPAPLSRPPALLDRGAPRAA